MTQFNKNAYETLDNIKVVSVEKSWFEAGNVPDWFTPTIDYGVTESGLLVPKRVTSSGQQEVQQVGSIVKLKEYNGVNDLLSYTHFRYGENTGRDKLTPLDVSKYPKRSIYIENNYDQSIKIDIRIKDLSVDVTPYFDKIIDMSTLASGAGIWISDVDYPKINTQYPGLVVTLTHGTTPPTSGSVNIQIYGSVL